MTPNLPRDSAKAKNNMFEKGIAVVALTRQGVQTALRIKDALDAADFDSTVYAQKKYRQDEVSLLDKGFAVFLKDVYCKVDAVVAVMATGITIRAVAPLLESKLTDPAIIGVDAAGKFVISLLSGHFGGANELTRIIAGGIGATPVVTTASDAMGKMCVEDIAKTWHLSIENPKSLVAVNSAIVNGDNLVVVLVGDLKIDPTTISCYQIKKAVDKKEALEVIHQFEAGILVTAEPLAIDGFSKTVTILRAKRIVVGLGARKESSQESIVKAIEEALDSVHIYLSRVDCFATVDIKKTSEPMVKAVEQMGAPLEFLSVQALRSVKNMDLSPDSELVQEKIGVGGVCERAAIFVAGKNPKLILKKTKLNGVTVAIATGE
jgi:cobalt-precorrin 5A hydrolase